MAPKDKWFVSPCSVIFGILFPQTCTFCKRKSYKCKKPRFPTFFQKLKNGLHTCTFYHGKTYKCAVTVFTILKFFKCKQPKTSNAPRHVFGATFASIGTLLVTFWFNLGRVGHILDPFWNVYGPFSLSLARFWFPNIWKNFLEHFQQSTLRKYQAPWPSHPTLPMGPERNLAAGKFDYMTYICTYMIYIYIY